MRSITASVHALQENAICVPSLRQSTLYRRTRFPFHHYVSPRFTGERDSFHSISFQSTLQDKAISVLLLEPLLLGRERFPSHYCPSPHFWGESDSFHSITALVHTFGERAISVPLLPQSTLLGRERFPSRYCLSPHIWGESDFRPVTALVHTFGERAISVPLLPQSTLFRVAFLHRHRKP